MAQERVYKVVVVEDEEIILNNIIQKIEKVNPLFKVVGSAYDGREALEIINAMKPDALFTDIRMPIMDGLELIRQVKDLHPDMQIVILSGFDEFEYARKAITLGVKSYLLKPLKIDDLEETLRNISLRIQARIQNTERAILYSGLTGRPCTTELPYTFTNTGFFLFLIGIGNLCSNITSFEQLKFFNEAWNNVPLLEILNSKLNGHEKWWIVDEKCINQKFLIVPADAVSTDNSISLASQIMNSIYESVHPLPVNICTDQKPIPYNDIWILAQRLRLSFEQGLVIGKSQVLTPIAVDNINLVPALLDSATQNKFMTLLQSSNTNLIRQELSSLFAKWEEFSYTQRWIEKVLHQLLKLIQRQIISLSEAELIHIEYKLFESISVSSDLKPVYDKLSVFLESMLSAELKDTDEISDVLALIDDYIRAHYTEQISIEDISRKFNFNPSYLTRMFKKHKGETPLKLIINLRIAEAKRLMEEQTDLDIKEIGEITGYPDQHYFCRIFKNVTGMSPSEFRESIMSR